jgi:beta-lactam-binding protein with PASTA domain
MKWIKFLILTVTCVLVFILATSLTIRFLLKDDASVSCPNLLGLDIEEAKKSADRQGLLVHVVKYEPRNDIPYNRVLVQKPDASTSVRAGRAVAVILSNGPKPQTIPDIVGLSINDAMKNLDQLGIAIKKIIYVPGEDDGKVLAQTPSGGQNIMDPEGMVLIAAGKTKRFFIMPDIEHSDMTTITEEMNNKGIRFAVSSNLPNQSKSTISKNKILPKSIFSDDSIIEINAPVTPAG